MVTTLKRDNQKPKTPAQLKDPTNDQRRANVALALDPTRGAASRGRLSSHGSRVKKSASRYDF
jgi:hypothetical protein